MKNTRFLKSVLFLSLTFVLGVISSGFYFKAQRSPTLFLKCYPEYQYMGYSVIYDAKNKVPLYTYERLTAKNLVKNADRSKILFSENSEVYKPFRSKLIDYQNSGFDRGHMAAAANQRFDQKCLEETFLLTNICPQNSVLNRGLWFKIEQYARGHVKAKSQVEIISGPLFLAQSIGGKSCVKYELIGKNQVAVPTHFFKIIYIKDKESSNLICYLVPNSPLGLDQKIQGYQVSLDRLESISGYQILAK